LPAPILDYLHDLTVEKCSPAYLFVEKDGCLIKWGGELSGYGIKDLSEGESIVNTLFFTEGLFPLNEKSLFFPRVKVENNRSTDIHIFAADEGYWILLLDASAEERRWTVLQQNMNELSLLRSNLSKKRQLITSMETNEVLFNLQEKGERRYVTVLFAKIHGINAYSRQAASESLFATLEQHFSAMARSIIDEGGTLNEIAGDRLIAVFGLEHAIESSSLHAVQAALSMFDDLKEINRLNVQHNRPEFNIGIGITSGQVSLGVIRIKKQKIFNAVGDAVHIAARLEQEAGPDKIYIDRNTFKHIKQFQKLFSASTLRMPSVNETLQVFSCEVG